MKRWWKRMAAGVMLAGVLCTAAMIQPDAALAEGEDQPVYHAAMGIQTATQIWIQRWGYYDSSYNEYYDTEDYDKLYDSHKKFYDGTFEDVEIRGNGTYTVTLKDADFAGETTVSQLHIATDIPVADSEKLQFTDIKLEVNGSQVLQFDEAVMEDEENYTQGGAVILLFNHWRDKLKESLSGIGKGEDSSNGWDILQGTGSENVSIRFTVSGLPYDNKESVVETESPDTGQVLTEAKGSPDTQANGRSVEDSLLSAKQIIGVVGLAVIMLLVIITILYKKSKKEL